MEHPDLAQLAAVGGAIGSVLVLLARGRFVLLAGLVVLALAEGALAYSLGTGSLDRLSGATGRGRRGARDRRRGRRGGDTGAAARDRSGRRAAGRSLPAAALVRQRRHLPGLDRRRRPPGPAAAALLRAGGGRHRARLARAARARDPRAPHRDRRAGGRLLRVRLPVARVGGRPRGRRQPARLLHAAVRAAARDRRARRLPRQRPARAGGGRARARDAVRAGRPLAGRHPRALLLRAQPGRVERQHGLLPRHVAVRRPEPLRPPPRARHRRGAVAARGAALEAVAADRPARGHVGRASSSPTRSRASRRCSS